MYKKYFQSKSNKMLKFVAHLCNYIISEPSISIDIDISCNIYIKKLTSKLPKNISISIFILDK